MKSSLRGRSPSKILRVHGKVAVIEVLLERRTARICDHKRTAADALVEALGLWIEQSEGAKILEFWLRL
jgi:hypothetical protein